VFDGVRSGNGRQVEGDLIDGPEFTVTCKNPVRKCGRRQQVEPAMVEDALISTAQVNTTSKLDEVAEAYADLWFYSNAIFLNVE
jgi:hypothetical protein